MAIIRRGETERGLTRGGTSWDPFEVMQDLMRWDPFRELTRGVERPAFAPSFEVRETKDAYVFKADLPGLREEDLDISLTGSRLTIAGQRQEEKREEGERFYTYERSFGAFSRSFTLPEGVDAEHVQGEMKDGVLTVVIPKTPEVQPKRIQLKGMNREKDVKA